jgi:hypothetical protein
MEKCKECKWHKSKMKVVYEILIDLSISGDYEYLVPDFEHTLCGFRGCKEPEENYMAIHGTAVAKRARLKLRNQMGLAAFTESFPDWAKELATQDKAMYEGP